MNSADTMIEMNKMAGPLLKNSKQAIMFSDQVASSLPDAFGKTVMVRVYGLIGHTHCLDLQFDTRHVVPNNIFVFEDNRYKIISVIALGDNQFGMNTISIEHHPS